jgi:DNA-directed RNA polymerase subunit RPC12/RpoP
VRETTYRELFEEAIGKSIATYGELWRIVTLVNIYQGTDEIARHCAFGGWVEGASFSCGRCREIVTPDGGEIEEETAVVCEQCQRKDRR